MVVTDNSLLVESIRGATRDSGALQLVGYADARKTSARLVTQTGVDLVLLDEADRSEEALWLIRSIKEANDTVTVIVLTARMDGEWLTRALEAGAGWAISKSVHPNAMATLVREALSGHVVQSLQSVPAEPEARAPATGGHRSPLTDRELQILQLVASGATNGEVARRLWITQQTVKFHLSNIYRKLAVANRTEACHYAHLHGLVAPGAEASVGVFASATGAPAEEPELIRDQPGQSRAEDRLVRVRARV
jgi:DNA-binding NarL/FixJ family response regulator